MFSSAEIMSQSTQTIISRRSCSASAQLTYLCRLLWSLEQSLCHFWRALCLAKHRAWHWWSLQLRLELLVAIFYPNSLVVPLRCGCGPTNFAFSPERLVSAPSTCTGIGFFPSMILEFFNSDCPRFDLMWPPDAHALHGKISMHLCWFTLLVWSYNVFLLYNQNLSTVNLYLILWFWIM